jgi:hypothetical protein
VETAFSSLELPLSGLATVLHVVPFQFSIRVCAVLAEAARARSGPSGLSGYVAAAVARQIERDNLNDLIAVAEAEHGPVTEEEVRARREELRRARTEQGHLRSGAA